MLLTKLITLAVAGVLQVHGQSEWDGEAEFIPPSILIPVFVRNKEHALPYFFGGLERQNYPKSRIRLWFVTDHNADNSLEVIKAWKEAWEVFFDNIFLFSLFCLIDGIHGHQDRNPRSSKRALERRSDGTELVAEPVRSYSEIAAASAQPR